MNRRRGLFDQRGASLTEYVLILVAVLVIVAGGYKLLGKKGGQQTAQESGKTFTGETADPDGNGGAGVVGGKSKVATKMSIAAGGGAPVKPKSTFVDDTQVKITNAIGGDLDFSFKKMARWLAIMVVALGLGVGFAVYKRARGEQASKEGEGDATPDGTGAAKTAMGPGGVAPSGGLPGGVASSGIASSGIASSGGSAPTKYTD